MSEKKLEPNTYSAMQLFEHGELIVKYLRDPKATIQTFVSGDWKDTDKPLFNAFNKYRIKPQPKLIYTNSLGEEFYEGDTAYWVSFDFGTDNITMKSTIINTNTKNIGFASCHESAYILSIMYLRKQLKLKTK